MAEARQDHGTHSLDADLALRCRRRSVEQAPAAAVLFQTASC